MGLDSVELVLRMEDEFNITISDEEAAETRSVGDVYNLILSKLDVSPSCLSSKAFYRTRRTLVECLNVPRRSIRPTTILEPLLPERTRRQQWQQISKHLGLSIPNLRVPDSKRQAIYNRSFIAAIVISITLGGLAMHWHLSILQALFLSMLACFPVVMGISNLVLKLNPSLANNLPADTAGELARVVLSLNHRSFATIDDTQKMSSDYVWEKIVDIFCDQLQVSRDEVVPNAKIVDDLGVS